MSLSCSASIMGVRGRNACVTCLGRSFIEEPRGMVVDQAEVQCPRCDSASVREGIGWASDGDFVCLTCGYGFRD